MRKRGVYYSALGQADVSGAKAQGGVCCSVPGASESGSPFNILSLRYDLHMQIEILIGEVDSGNRSRWGYKLRCLYIKIVFKAMGPNEII